MLEMNLIDERKGTIQTVSERNQRHFRGRDIKCSTCEEVSEFDKLPHSCVRHNCSNSFESGADILLLDKHIWWDDNLLRKSKILVIGCGAVGNEVVKTLVLIGAKNFTLIDFDEVEESNRARTVLFNNASMKAVGEHESHMKVDVMAAGILNLDSEASVMTVPKGIPDWRTTAHNEAVASGEKSGKIRPVLTDEEMFQLADSHDLAIIGTDGISPHAYFNYHCYSRIPQVRGSMNTAGSSSVVSTTVPYVTACLQCHDIQSPLVTRGKDGILDWSMWNTASGFNCKQVAEESGAASFAHANSVVASAMASQAILVLHGYPTLKESKLSQWPVNIPAPVWDARIELPTYLPHKTQLTPIPLNLDLDGLPECPACSALFNDDFHYTWERYGFSEVENTPRFDVEFNPFAKKKPTPPKSKIKEHLEKVPPTEVQPPSPSDNSFESDGEQSGSVSSKPPPPPPKSKDTSIEKPPPVTDLPEPVEDGDMTEEEILASQRQSKAFGKKLPEMEKWAEERGIEMPDMPPGEEPPNQVSNRPPPPPPPKSKDTSNEKPPPVTPLPDPVNVTNEEWEEQTRQLKQMYENADNDRPL